MIFAHSIIGALPVESGSFSLAWFIGSIIPDIDHVFVLLKHRILRPRQVVEAMRFEDKQGLRFKTPAVHSLFGAVVCSLPAFLFDARAGIFFLLGYVLHLLIDWLDTDEKRYLFPLGLKIRGSLPIFSKFERVTTALLLVVLISAYSIPILLE